MLRAAAIALVLVTGCAAARITPSPSGPVVTAIAIGTARVMACDDGTVTMGSADAALLGNCVVVQGGALSPAVVDIAATVGSVLAAWFTAGVAW